MQHAFRHYEKTLIKKINTCFAAPPADAISELASKATHVAQAVPGALIQTAARRGKVVCIQDPQNSYLPPEWITPATLFFSKAPTTPRETPHLDSDVEAVFTSLLSK